MEQRAQRFFRAGSAALLVVLASGLGGCAQVPREPTAAGFPAGGAARPAEGAPGAEARTGGAAEVASEVASEVAVAPAGADDAALQHIARSPWSGDAAGVAWTHFGVPGKRATRFAYERVDDRPAVSAHAQSSASLLRRAVRVEPSELGQLYFSWKVPALITEADMSRRDKDDAPVRIVLAFDGDRSRFSVRDALLAELTRAITGEEMPYATLMYVWCNRTPVGGVIHNPRTDRIRKYVIESGPGALGRWIDYARDVRADYERAFGEPPGALIGVAIMTDSDNTRSSARAWYGPVRFRPPAASAAGVDSPKGERFLR